MDINIQPILQTLVLAISLSMAAAAALGLATWFSLVIWTFHDVRLRSNDVFTQLMATLMVAVLFIPGVLLYTLLRPAEQLSTIRERKMLEEALNPKEDPEYVCPACEREVTLRWMVCPYCLYQLREPCSQCGELMELDWRSCAYCGQLSTEQRQGALTHTHVTAPPELSLPERTRPAHPQLSAEARPAI